MNSAGPPVIRTEASQPDRPASTGVILLWQSCHCKSLPDDEPYSADLLGFTRVAASEMDRARDREEVLSVELAK